MQDDRALEYYNTRTPKLPKKGTENTHFFKKKIRISGLHVEIQILTNFGRIFASILTLLSGLQGI